MIRKTKLTQIATSFVVSAVIAGLAVVPANAQQNASTGNPVEKTSADARISEGNGDGIGAAKTALEDVEHRAVQLEKVTTGLMEEIERLQPNDLPGEARTISKFRNVLALVQVQGRKIAEYETTFQSIAGLYKTALSKAPKEFRRAAVEYQRLAKEEKFPELAQYYEKMAVHAAEDATLFEKRAAGFDTEVGAVTQKVVFIRSTIKLAQAMADNLDLTPDPQKAAQLARFAESLERYISTFRKTVDAFRRFHEQRLFNPPADSTLPAPAIDPVVPPGLPQKVGMESKMEEMPSSPRSSRVTVLVPANARLWVNDREFQSTSAVRSFETPPLAPRSGGYFYSFKVELVRGGQVLTQTRRATVTPGQPVHVDFNMEAVATASR